MNANIANILMQAFVIFNTIKIVQYIFQVYRLRHVKNNLDTHSIKMNAIMVMSNLTITLAFYIKTNNVFDYTVVLSSLNNIALALILYQIIFKRIKYKSVSERAIKLSK